MSRLSEKSRKDRLLVIGGNAAGMSAASKAKRLRPDLDVIALEKSPHVSYSACGIPYFVSDLVRDPGQLVALTPQEFQTKRGIQVCTLHDVVDISPVKRRVTAVDLATGREVGFDYDRLMIAVGGRPHLPAPFNPEAANVFSIQTLQDGIRIKQYIDTHRPRSIVLIGGGYIAMEMAEACRLRGRDVTILEKAPRILPGFDDVIAGHVAAELSANSVRVVTDVQALDTNGDGAVTSISAGAGSFDADLVLVCAGMRPNTDLAKIAGARLGKTGAIKTDWKMQTSAPNIYAGGDCVEVRNLVSGGSDYIPLGTTANKHGRVAGENIGGGTATFKGVVGTSVFKVFGLEVARTGLALAQARESGFDADAVTISENSRAAYYPNAQKVVCRIIFDKRTGLLLGGQMLGREGVSKRIDILAVALANKMTLEETANMDLSYAPPFAPVWDPVLVAVNVARGKMQR